MLTATTTYKDFNTGGQPKTQQTVYTNAKSTNTEDNLTRSYAGFGDWRLQKMGGTRTNAIGTSDYASSGIYYDPNSALSGMRGGTSFSAVISTYDGLTFLKQSLEYVGFKTYYTEERKLHDAKGMYMGTYSRTSQSSRRPYSNLSFVKYSTTRGGGQAMGYNPKQSGRSLVRGKESFAMADYASPMLGFNSREFKLENTIFMAI